MFSCITDQFNKKALELVLPWFNVVFSLTSELSVSTVITSHTYSSWIITTAALLADKGKIPNGIEAPGV